ncbi:lysophospholipase [Arthrobacter crystallopoietes BAB-32]|uniref:Lysophospholipase n=1 Tax=Arthrobacter crystallopoietes BAB-32 TaxID=1246476 RepID=N1VB84_9MICC|nr:alpha/beta hydrolase [Arthrobacter crystallopoietes]EMY35573.1 lysophospholipase [Arthrobacter crystallopoietes BAB-32]
MPAVWIEDILGAGFESTALEVPAGDGATRRATLVRHLPQAGGAERAGHVVLYLHGWSDYFFNTELADFWHRLGVAFYALDVHNHGRNLRIGEPDQGDAVPGDSAGADPESRTVGGGDLAGYASDLADYDDEIATAVAAVREDAAARLGLDEADIDLTLMGHSTGGLVAALWTNRNPGAVKALVLNSPWLEVHRSSLVRRAAAKVLDPLSRLKPEAEIRLPARGFYWRTISSTEEGEWDLDPDLRPPFAFPVRAGWLSAVWQGQSEVDKGLSITAPVLVLTSARSVYGPLWHEDMKAADAVLDVETMAASAVKLGSTVTVERIEAALHDIFLSRPEVRADAYARLERWAKAYILSGRD